MVNGSREQDAAPIERPALCVVNFNGALQLPECLTAVSPIRDQFQELLLVDNGSSDGSVVLVRQQFPFIRILELGANLGPASARNAALEALRSDRILFLDNDVSPTPDCLHRLCTALDNHPAAVLALPTIVYEDRRNTVQYDGAGCHYLGLMVLHHADTPLDTASAEDRQVNAMVSSCFLLDRGRWRRQPRFDDSFFMYYEDLDFGLQARLLGHTILSVPRAISYHGSGTAGLALRTTQTFHPLRVERTLANRWRTLIKHFHWWSLCLLAPMLVLFELVTFTGVLVKGWLKPWSRAVRSTVLDLPEILRQRHALQSERRIPDREILEGGTLPFSRQLISTPIERLARNLLQATSSGYWFLIRRLL